MTRVYDGERPIGHYREADRWLGKGLACFDSGSRLIRVAQDDSAAIAAIQHEWQRRQAREAVS